MQDFVHLHVHTQYSLLDGQASVSALVDKAMKDGMKGIAVTDHGNMFGIKEFTNYVNKKNGGPKGEIKDLKKRIAGIESGEIACEDKDAELADCRAKLAEAENKLFKPIIGCEMYVARRTMDKKEGKPDQSGWHLIVLAKNEKGYHNLIKLVSRAWTEGYYMRPRTDRNELEKYHEGLIVCSACIGGEVPKKILNDQLEDAEEAVRWYKNLFGEDYYLELQRHKATVPRANHEAYPLQQRANAKLIEFAKKYNIKLICSNDVHFVNEEHAEAHDRLICLSTGKDLDDPKRMLYTKQEWMKTKAEMNELFADIPEALSNTLEILNKVEYYSIDHAPIMPTFAIPEDFGTEEGYRQKYTEKDLFDEFTQDENGNVVLSEEAAKAKIKRLGGYEKLYRIKLEADYLAKLTFDGAKIFYGDPLSEEVMERLKFELYIMKTMGFPGYFLIVQDFIAAGRNMGVSVGPGRGSAAGSAVAYCLQITKIDPIKYDLLFERFLNPDRISLPDIDIDFDDDGRGEVLRWVTQKYGQEKVAHIITYGTMATKLAIKDVARVQKLPLSESDRLAKLVPDKIPDKKLNLRNAIDYVPELQAAEASPDPLVRDTLKYAKRIITLEEAIQRQLDMEFIDSPEEVTALNKKMGIANMQVSCDIQIINCTYGYSRRVADPKNSTNKNCRLKLNAYDRTRDGTANLVYGAKLDTEGILFEISQRKIVEWLYENNIISEEQLPDLDDDISVKKWFAQYVHSDVISMFGEIDDSEKITKNVFALLHSMSHAFMNSAGELSGLSGNSLTEIILVETASIFIYAQTSQGIPLGALSGMAESNYAYFLKKAFDEAKNCVFDPICTERDDTACSACLIIPEISCNHFNAELGRKYLYSIDGVDNPTVGFWEM